MRHIDNKVIGFSSRSEAAVFVYNGAYPVGNAFQHFIGVLSSVTLIYEMEVIDIDDQGIHLFSRMILIEPLTVAIEILPCVKAGKAVVFCLADDHAAF